MNLIEITCPEGTLDETQRQAIAHDVLSTLLVEPDAPPQAVERAGHLTHVWFHAARTWTTRAGQNQDSASTPFVVTITVPEGWREELSRRAIGAVRTALTRHVTLAAQNNGAVWINVVGVHDGSIGMNGKPSTSTDIVRYLTQNVEPPDAQDLSDDEVIDPVCGMRVHLGPHAHTLTHNGQTIGFCASGCRAVYAEDHNIPIDA
jgi:YHS domain-containing protein/phenylpyruvate tautomerase PptA (4-oxalocrotonate tautomerase family)